MRAQSPSREQVIGRGQPPSREDDTQAKNVVRDFSQAVAATYEISVNDDTVLHLQKEPVLGWSNPVRISKYGYVFVWTDREISLVTG